jgi:Peptidase MA superfamily
MISAESKTVPEQASLPAVKPGWQTTEFWGTMIKLALSFAVAVLGVTVPDSSKLEGAAVAIVTAIFAIVYNSHTVINYIRSRFALKTGAKALLWLLVVGVGAGSADAQFMQSAWGGGLCPTGPVGFAAPFMQRQPPLASAVVQAPAQIARSKNFVVSAGDPQTAKRICEWAEHYRREKALDWLGQEMPAWPQQINVQVKTNEPAGGATTFIFAGGRVQNKTMELSGTPDKIVSCILPHEVTHTVFANYFGRPVPRWADEGGAMLSEDYAEQSAQAAKCRQLLNANKQYALRQLFTLDDYPSDSAKIMALYAQSFSVSHSLVDAAGKKRFLAFVAQGMSGDWDRAAQQVYGFRSVEDLEQSWLKHMRATKGMPLAKLR